MKPTEKKMIELFGSIENFFKEILHEKFYKRAAKRYQDTSKECKRIKKILEVYEALILLDYDLQMVKEAVEMARKKIELINYDSKD